MTLLAGGRVVLADRVLAPGWVRVEGTLVAEVGSGPPPGEAEHFAVLLPGLVDLHAHGGGGASFTEDPVRAAAFHRARGSTTVVASLVSAPLDTMVAQVGALAAHVADGTVAGIHLEGPFLAPSRCGAHDARHLVAPTPVAVDRLLAAGPVVMVTLAPELDGGLDAVRWISGRGVVAAVGHTDADYATARRAVAAGATVATHLGNAMPPVHHREPGAVVALAEAPEVTLEVIADGTHLHPAVVRGVLATGRAALVSDATAAAGQPDGPAELGGLRVLVADGAARLADTGALAGSVVTVADCLARVLGDGADLLTAVTAATRTPRGSSAATAPWGRSGRGGAPTCWRSTTGSAWSRSWPPARGCRCTSVSAECENFSFMDHLQGLTPSQLAMVTETLRVSLRDAARAADPDRAQALASAAALLAEPDRDPHPALPAVGTAVGADLVVGEDDTAASMGHPDTAMAVLGSPRLSLWFELVASGALPDPGSGASHVGVGILVHHLDRAVVGETVRVTATVESVSGRRVTFRCAAAVGERVVARGTHQRVLLELR